MAKKPSITMRRRMFFAMSSMIVVGFTVLSCALIYIQIVKGEEYSQLAINQQLVDTEIASTRGSILDTNMKTLAASATVWTVVVSPTDTKESQKDTIIEGLSEILDVEESVISEALEQNNYYEVISRKVELEIADEVLEFATEYGINSISLIEDSKRYYPYDTLLSNVLGFVGTDNQGLSGLESYYDEYLTGTSGRVISAQNGWGDDMPFQYEGVYDAEDGYNLVLTVDETLQHYLEKYLELACEEYQAENGGGAIAMDPNTGEILAMATVGNFDPNEPFVLSDEDQALVDAADEEDQSALKSELRQAQWRNGTVSDLYEPGSVFKVVTAAAALEEGVTTLDEEFFCSGSEVVADIKISCWKTEGHGTESMLRGFCNSCNPMFIILGQRLGAYTFVEYFEAFGLGDKTGIDLPAEASSIYYTADQMGEVELASTSFGQSNKITPIQMITAVCAAVNGGTLMQPYIVSRITDSDGNIVQTYDPTEVRSVISESTSQMILEMMEQNCIDGTSTNGYISGYSVGGKTGTSQKLDSDDETAYIASYVAVAPCDDPQIVVLYFIDTPRSGEINGSAIAAPAARDFLNEALPYLGVTPVYSTDELEVADVTVSSVVGLDSNTAKNTLGSAGLSYKTVGTGTTVLRQYPEAGTIVPRGSTIMLYTEDSEEVSYTTVPNVSGMSIENAEKTLSNAGLNIKIIGSGTSNSDAYAIDQDVASGTVVEMGTTITVEFTTDSNVF